MRSKWPLLWICLAAVCGAMLFRTSQMVTDGHARLDVLAADTVKEQESIRVLQAEWGYLNQPARLEKLARAHLRLEPMKGRQFAAADTLDKLAPAAGDEAPVVERLPPEEAAPVVSAPPRVKPEPVKKEIVKKAVVKKDPPPKKKPAPAKAAPRRPPGASPGQRGFGDLMKSLGVH